MSFNIVLIGPQGSGKGTVATLLKKKLGIPHISMGDLLRETLHSNSPIGAEVQSFISKGELVPLEIIQKMLIDRLAQPDCDQGFLLDGFPRDKAQANLLKSTTQISFVIVLEVSREISLQRIGGRVQCKNCGAIFNLQTKRPIIDGICDECGHELYQREDDTKDAIYKRLDIYETQTKPLLEEFESLIVRIDTSLLTPEEIVEIILRATKK